jgi:hypothetical protein
MSAIWSTVQRFLVLHLKFYWFRWVYDFKLAIPGITGMNGRETENTIFPFFFKSHDDPLSKFADSSLRRIRGRILVFSRTVMSKSFTGIISIRFLQFSCLRIEQLIHRPIRWNSLCILLSMYTGSFYDSPSEGEHSLDQSHLSLKQELAWCCAPISCPGRLTSRWTWTSQASSVPLGRAEQLVDLLRCLLSVSDEI